MSSTTAEFEQEAVRQVSERGYWVAAAARSWLAAKCAQLYGLCAGRCRWICFVCDQLEQHRDADAGPEYCRGGYHRVIRHILGVSRPHTERRRRSWQPGPDQFHRPNRRHYRTLHGRQGQGISSPLLTAGRATKVSSTRCTSGKSSKPTSSRAP